MRKLLALFSAVLMLFSSLVPVTASAGERAYAGETPCFYSKSSASVESSLSQPTVLPDGLYSYVVNKMKNCTALIDISSYNVTVDQHKALMMDITNSEPELFHLLNTWDYYTDRTGKYVTAFEPHYSMESSAYTEALAYVRAEADKVIASVDSSWTDLEKALYLHDYIIAWYEYDTDLQIQDVYYFLKTGEGVCEAYQLYYMYLLNKLGIPNDYIASSSMAHVWNRVSIGGNWYNVDVTWDDPDNNHMAETDHDYFLFSDAAMSDHYGGVSDVACTSTKYDNYSWKDVRSAVVPLGDKWYVIVEHYIAEYEPSTGEYDTVYDITERWPADQDGHVWNEILSGLSAYKGCLIFVTPKSFMAYNPELDIAKELATYSDAGYLFDGVVDQSTGRYYVTVGTSRLLDGVTKYYQINEADLPTTATWVEYDREEPTCINPGFIYYRASEDSSTTKTETVPAVGHTVTDAWLSVTDGEGNVTAKYQVCTACGHKCNLKPVIPADFNGRFSDVKVSDWYASSVAYAVEKGLFGGVSATKFAPNTDMSRAMLVTVLWRLEGSPAPVGEEPFSDVKAGQWYTDAVAWAYENDIVGGVGGGRFAPDNTVTREQMATILYRYSAGKGYALDKDEGIANFPDTSDVSAYAVDGYSWARTMGIIDGMSKGDGKIYLNPKGYATRAQVATMLTRFVVYVCEA